MQRDAFAGAAFSLAATEAVKALLQIATPIGAECIAIKGFHVAQLGGEALLRSMGDVDLVIGDAAAHERVLEALRARPAWEVGPDEDHSTPVRGPFGVALDLHRTPLPRQLGYLDAAKLRSRASPARSVPGLLIPDAVDGAILALVHFTKDRLGTFGSSHVSEDLAVFAASGATPELVAARVDEHGLRRAAMIALCEVERRDARAGAWLAAMRPARGELGIARVAAATLRSLGERAPRATWWAVRLLPDSVKQAAQGVLWQVRVSLGRRRIR